MFYQSEKGKWEHQVILDRSAIYNIPILIFEVYIFLRCYLDNSMELDLLLQ